MPNRMTRPGAYIAGGGRMAPSSDVAGAASWPFSDGFSNFDDWTNYKISGSDEWSAAGGLATISHTNAGTTIAYYDDQGSSVNMECAATTDQGGNNTGCGPVVRGDGADTCYCLQVSGPAASYGTFPQKWVSGSLTEFSQAGSSDGDWKLTINGTTLTVYKWVEDWEGDPEDYIWEQQSQDTDSDITTGLYGGFMSRFWGGTGGTDTIDDWSLTAIGGCPERVAKPKGAHSLVWVPLTGAGTNVAPYRADLSLEQRVGLVSDDSIPVDLATGKPLLSIVPVLAPAKVAGGLPGVDPDRASVWLWEAIRRSRRNAYFVADGVHPRGEMHCREYTWPSRGVPGGRVFYRPAPFAAMPTVEDDANPKAAIEDALSNDSLEVVLGGRNEKVSGIVARMVDHGHGGKFGAASEAVRQLSVRGLSASAARAVTQRFGLSAG